MELVKNDTTGKATLVVHIGDNVDIVLVDPRGNNIGFIEIVSQDNGPKMRPTSVAGEYLVTDMALNSMLRDAGAVLPR